MMLMIASGPGLGDLVGREPAGSKIRFLRPVIFRGTDLYAYIFIGRDRHEDGGPDRVYYAFKGDMSVYQLADSPAEVDDHAIRVMIAQAYLHAGVPAQEAIRKDRTKVRSLKRRVIDALGQDDKEYHSASPRQ